MKRYTIQQCKLMKRNTNDYITKTLVTSIDVGISITK